MQIIRRLLDLILPASCAFCRNPLRGSPFPYFCTDCWSDFSGINGPVCPQCGRLYGSPESLTHSPDHLCSRCRQAPPRYDQAFAAGLFEGPLREAIHVFKYRPARSLGSRLAAWMGGQVRLVRTVDAVMPVPLHRSRLRQRGFNQSLLLAAGIAERFGLPLSFDNLVRHRATRPQVELSGVDRSRNVRDAFSLRRPELVENRNILLIDDVFTTGATMDECAGVLSAAGAGGVTAFTLARTAE